MTAVLSPQAPYAFCGNDTDNDALLEALVASHVKRVAAGVVVRDLVPWDPVAFGVTKRALKAQRAPLEVAADHLGLGVKRGKPARDSSSGQRARSTASPKPVPAKVARSYSSTSNKQQSRAGSPSSTVFAGPGFCVSPAPEALPMPTRVLLASGRGSLASLSNAAAVATDDLKRLLQVPVAACAAS